MQVINNQASLDIGIEEKNKMDCRPVYTTLELIDVSTATLFGLI